MQFPAETMIIDALRILAVDNNGEPSGALYESVLRVTDGRGRAGTREGVMWPFTIGSEGFEPYPEPEPEAQISS